MALSPKYLQIGHDIIKAAFEVHTQSGPYMREKYYEAALAYELRRMGYNVQTQVPIKAWYKGVEVMDAFVADIVVNDEVIIELKAVRQFGNEVARQLSTYLRLGQKSLGYIINFGAPDFSVSNFRDELSPYEKGIYRLVFNI